MHLLSHLMCSLCFVLNVQILVYQRQRRTRQRKRPFRMRH